MNQSYTITMLYVDEQGIEHVDFNHADIESHAARRAALDQVEQQQEQYITHFEDGSSQHYYDIGEQGEMFDEGQRIISEYEEGDEWESEDEDESDPHFVNAVLETVEEHICSLEDYDAALDWAAENLDDDECEYFNNAIDSEDPELIIRCIAALVELYNEEEDDE